MRSILTAVVFLCASLTDSRAETTAVFVSVVTAAPNADDAKVTVVSGGKTQQNLSVTAAAQILKEIRGSGSNVWVYMRTDGDNNLGLGPLFSTILGNPMMELRYFHTNVNPIHAEELLQTHIPSDK